MPRSSTPTASRRQAPSPGQASTAITQYDERAQHPIVQHIDAQMPSIAQMLPRSADPVRFKAMVLQALINNPDILGCTFPSIIRAVIQAAQEGIPITGQPGGAYLVPFRPERNAQPEATLLRDYRALIRMAIRSGAATKIESATVRRGDAFTYQLGDEPKISHEPKAAGDADGIAWYAIATLPNGDKQREVMDRVQVEHVRAKSRQKDGKPWTQDFDQMARKTVIRRLINYLDLTPEQREALDREERLEYGDGATVVRASAVPQHGDLRERGAQRAQLLEGGTEQPGRARADENGADDGRRAPADKAAPSAAASAPEGTPAPGPTEPTLEEATKAVYAAAAGRGLTKGLEPAEAWKAIDELAHEAIPDTDPEDLTVADWLAIRERVDAGEFDQPTARPRA